MTIIKNTPIVKLLFYFTFFICGFSVVFGQGSGNIKGIVTDKLSSDPLIGANVFLEGTSLGGAANINGEYYIQNAPAGKYNLIIKYIGYKQQSMPITVVADRTLGIDIELEYVAIESEEIKVTAQAIGQMSAINQQLSSETIKNVVSSDKIQDIPDVNAAESVARLPGISLIRSGGEGQKVAIRGMSPKYNVMMVNGVRMQSTDRDDRSVDLNMISSNILDGIEVTKAITADMDADAVGGTVNLRLGKADKDFKGKFSLQDGYGSVAENFDNYKMNGFLSTRLFDDKLGVQISGSADRYDRYSDNLGASYTTNEESIIVDGLVDIDLANASITDNVRDRQRLSGSLIFDYQFENGSLFLNNFISNLAEDQIIQSNSLGLSDYSLNSNTTAVEMSNTVLSNALQGEYNLYGIKMDFSLSNSISKQYRPGDLVMNVIPQNGVSGFTTTANEKSTPSEFLNNVNVFDILRVNYVRETTRDVEEAERTAILNFELPFYLTDNISGKVKLGGKYRHINRDNDETQNYIKPDRHWESQQFTIRMMDENLWPELGLEQSDAGSGIRASLFQDNDYDIGNFLSGEEGVNDLYYTGDVSKMEHYVNLAKQYDSFFDDPQNSYQRDYNYTAEVSAFYLMTEINITKYIMLLPGIRYERYFTDYLAYQTEKWGPNWYDYRNEKVTSKRDNEDWFPQLHVRIKPTDWLDIRLASTQSIIYPDYRAISPFYYYNTNTGPDLSLGNTELKSAKSSNYDIYASVYDNYIGLFTAGLFYKEVENLITTYSFDTKDSEKINNTVSLGTGSNTAVSTWINLEGDSYVRGFELDWQTHFWYLPSFLQGLVLNINYTHMESETDYPFQIFVKQGTGIFAPYVAVDSSRSGRMPDQPDDILNTTIGYDYKGFSARLSFVFQGNVISSIADREELDEYTADYYRWDLLLQQDLPLEGMQVYFNFSNITNRPDRSYTSILEKLGSVNYYGRTADLGVRYEF